MSTPETVKAQLRLLLSNANKTTQADDATLTEANETLIAGYGIGGGNGEFILQEGIFTENGTYGPDKGFNGFSKVIVNVPTEGGSVSPGEINTFALYNRGNILNLREGYAFQNSEYIYGVYQIL